MSFYLIVMMACEFRFTFTTRQKTLNLYFVCWKAIWTYWSETERRTPPQYPEESVEYHAKPLTKKREDGIARITPVRWFWALLAVITLIISAVIMGTPLLAAQTQPLNSVTVIHAGKLFDSESGRLLDHPVVVVVGNHIEQVGTGNVPARPNARVLDLGDATLLPGFIDVHTHLTIDAGSGGYESLGVSVPR